MQKRGAFCLKVTCRKILQKNMLKEKKNLDLRQLCSTWFFNTVNDSSGRSEDFFCLSPSFLEKNSV